jgi:peptidyl-prolyl cis-trans isomerase D
MMMQGIRNAGRTWLGKLLVGILFTFLIFSFAIWGIGDIFRGGPQNVVATVGKTEITIEQVRNAYQMEVQRLSRRFRQNITPDQARILGLDRQVLTRLVTEAALSEDAAARGLTLSDALVAQSIVEDANFRNASGGFDRALFNDLLRQAGLNEASYVREQRAAMIRGQIAEAVSGAPSAPVALLEAAHRYRNEQRVLRFVELPVAKAGDIPAPTDEVLQRYFEERRASFRAPEVRSAQALVLTAATLADPSAVSEADAQAHYERIKSRFGTPERRTVQQIVFPTLAEAQAAAARITSGERFEAIAAERSVSDADLTLGSFTRAEMLDQQVAAAVFALAQGAVSQPVQGAFGYVLARASAIEAEAVRPFAQVAGEVRSDLALSRAQRELTETHDRIEDQRASARPLAEIARDKKLALTAIGPIDRQRQMANGQPAPAIPGLDQLVEAMFRADIGTDNEAVRLREGGYIWFDIGSIEPARDRNFAEVRDQVLGLWRSDETASRLQAQARALKDRLNAGETLDAIATTLGLQAQTSPPLTRASSLPEFPANVLHVAFATAPNAAESADLGPTRGRMLFRVESVTVPPFLRTTQEAQTMSDQLAQSLGDDLLQQYVNALQTRLGVRINERALRNATGGGES